jgi:flagellar protein FliJ
MAFKFRYQGLLTYRTHLKEKAEIEFGTAVRQLQKVRQVLKAYERQLQEARGSLDQGLTKRMHSEEVAMYADYLAGLKKKIVTQKQELVRRERIVEERKKELLERTKKCRIIEKLMERDHQAWRQQESLAEQKRIDELAVTRHGRSYL